MKLGQHFKFAVRWASTFAVVLALVFTRNCGRPTELRSRMRSPVDTHLLKTAQAIAHLASIQDERDFSGKLVKLADHELDIAFSIALREAAEHPVAVTPEAKELMARLKKSEAQVKTDEGQVELFRAQIRKVSGPQQQALQQQLEVLEAQLALDQDELQDAKQDLTRAGGDMAGSIQRLWEKHRAEAQEHGSKDPSIDTAANSAEAGYDAGNLIAQVAAWYALSRKTPLLMRAREEVLADTAALMYKHDTLEAVATSLSAQIPPQKNSQGAGFPLVRG